MKCAYCSKETLNLVCKKCQHLINHKHLLILQDRVKEIIIKTNWIDIAKECSIEKQIEIHSELKRTIKMIEKVIENGN